MADRPTEMDLAAFRDEGYLVAINQQVLHPLGLAAAVEMADDGVTVTRLLVLDGRDDPEGWCYGDVDKDLRAKSIRVHGELERRTPARAAALGYVVQPL